ncbi:hypothetical protein [Breznakiella homolactica]|uniref:Uncharacterized protein n=1 Tax=Breznakiella homolactica TaxID=2798577 RepID=A0A7T7XQL4_9SPIR|nr:hypothetical protein [Breznakiella homolactica]QQO10681.1 hypothetical protein JFL75_07120 [Breznakiella homolactica]
MDFDNLPLSRDLLYLAAALLGAAAGLLLYLVFPRRRSARSRSRIVTVCLCVLSAAVVSAAGAVVFSAGTVFSDTNILAVSLAAAAVFLLAVRFPRAAGFPLVILGGIAVVGIGFAFLRFPVLDTRGIALAAVRNDGGDQFSMSIADGAGNGAYRGFSPIEGTGSEGILEFSAAKISFAGYYPLIGGGERGILASVRRGDTELYADPRLAEPPLAGFYALFPVPGGRLGISLASYSGNLSLGTIPPGARRDAVFDGETVRFISPGLPVTP